MQACKNTYDKKTNKVANELNKLGIGKKTKYNREKATLPTRDSFQDVKEKGGGTGLFWGGRRGSCSGFHKIKKALRNMINIHIK